MRILAILAMLLIVLLILLILGLNNENNGTYINTFISSLGPVPNAEISVKSLHLGRVPGLKSIYLCMFLYLSLILIILIILLVLLILILTILGWSLRNRPKWRDLGEISAFGTGSRLQINILVHFILFKLKIDNINNINITNIGLEPQKPSQMQRSRWDLCIWDGFQAWNQYICACSFI